MRLSTLAQPLMPPAAEPLCVDVAGEPLELHGEHAVFWPGGGTLFIADAHWGKAATFRASAIPVPDTEVDTDLFRLSRVLDRTGAGRLVVLGDLLHNRRGRDEATFAAIAAWRGTHADIDVVLIEGNHDRSSGRVPKEWDIEVLKEPVLDGPFVLKHYPDADDRGYVLSGHLHPKVKLHSAALDRVKLPCFWFGESVGVLPAFGSLIDGAPVAFGPGDRVYAVAEGQVLDVSAIAEVPRGRRRPR